MTDTPSIFLSESGFRALIRADRFVPGAFELVVDGTPQSHVNLEDPTNLFFEYVSRMGHVIDLIGLPGEPITALHLGAGGFTIPRYIEATRPGSRQQVIELERDLVEFVRTHLPLPQHASIRVRYGDARATLGKLPEGLTAAADVIVVDVFSGARTPAQVTSVEFYRQVIEFLRPNGVLLVNAADGPPLSFAKGQLATLQAALPHVAAIAETQVLKGRRFGNVVLVGSKAELPMEWLPRLLAAGPHPAKAVAGDELRQFVAGAAVVTDETSAPSPLPARSVFQSGTRDA